MEQRRILIVGGGIAGPALALFLKQRGIRARIVEAHPRHEPSGGGFQVAPNGMRIIAKLGLAAEVEARGCVGEGFCFRNQRGAQLTDFSVPGRPVMLTRPAFHEVMLGAVKRAGLEIEYGKRLVSVEQKAQTVCARFDDGSEALADVLIGADGTHSRVREQVFPDAPKPQYLGVLGVGGFVDLKLDLPTHGRLQFIVGQHLQFGYGAMNAAGTSWGFWSHLPQREELSREALRALPDAQLRDDLLAAFGRWHGPADRMIRAASSIMRTPIHDVGPLPHWFDRRVVLMGDAAHAMSPTGGQGVSMALEDALYLGQTLWGSAQLEPAFADYERVRRARVEPIVRNARQNEERAQKPLGPAGSWFRDHMFKMFGPMMKRMLSEQYAYEVPTLVA